MDRTEEMARLDRLVASETGGLAVVWGRRRLGKTRLLLEWSARHDGLYTVADQSSAEIQRRYFAEAAAQRLPGFADVDYRDWRTLLARLAREARAAEWRGPIILDELPYLVLSSPELPSVLQLWIDHEAAAAKLVVAVAGSSQRMMQGIVLGSDAPLYGRATEALELGPLAPGHLSQAFSPGRMVDLVELHTAWGGVPRYWELASALGMDTLSSIEHLVLDPLGPLHKEPDRILIEEIPAALEVRPILDAIGGGAHRVSEIAGRIGRPATSMSRPLARLKEMGLVRRETPFSEPEKRSKRSLYRIADPFFRLWFRVVAPHRGQLTAADGRSRLELLERYWNGLVALAWEDLCRQQLPRARPGSLPGGDWGPAARWWRGNDPEWDVVSRSTDCERLLLGEAKWSHRPFSRPAVESALNELAAKAAPMLSERFSGLDQIRVLFLPELEEPVKLVGSEIAIITGSDLIG